MENNNYLSLFDFYGKPMGREFGKLVYGWAKHCKIKVSSRLVSEKKYSGEVILYPKYFLEFISEHIKTHKLL